MRIDPDGTMHLRQSDINTFFQCPEQLRLRWLMEKTGETFDTDAATVGSVTHSVIEEDITSAGGFDSLHDAQGFAAGNYLQRIEDMAARGGTYSMQTFGSHDKALDMLKILAEGWWKSPERHMLLHMEPDELISEWNFDRPFLDRGHMTVYLTGTVDLIIPDRNIMWDWKTASGAYKQWEKQRWAVQPTPYLWAGQDAGLIKPDDQGRFRFDYKVWVRAAKPKDTQTVSVYRSMGSFGWFANQVDRMVNFIEKMGMEDPWPLRDTDFLCGPKWCPFWDSCKGSHIDGERWY